MRIFIILLSMFISMYASDKISVDQRIGFSKLQINTMDNANGMIYGISFGIPLNGERMPVKHFEIGGDMTIGSYSAKKNYLKEFASHVLIGYRFNNHMKTRIGFGYQYINISDRSYIDGIEYTISTSVKIHDHAAIEIMLGNSVLSEKNNADLNTFKSAASLVFWF